MNLRIFSGDNDYLVKNVLKSQTIQIHVNPIKRLKMLPLDVLAIPALRILDHPQKNMGKKLGFPPACELTPEGSFCVKISAHYGEISLQGPIKIF